MKQVEGDASRRPTLHLFDGDTRKTLMSIRDNLQLATKEKAALIQGALLNRNELCHSTPNLLDADAFEQRLYDKEYNDQEGYNKRALQKISQGFAGLQTPDHQNEPHVIKYQEQVCGMNGIILYIYIYI